MVRILIGLFFLAVAVVLLAYAGGIDVRSLEEWRSVAQHWTLPSKDDSERGIVLVLGLLAALLALVRLITPRTRRVVPSET
jgi:hypothetical protein